ncbi:hypothetical protein V1273_004572 [Bradyrhizobium sp. AZCC 1721]
MHEHETYTTHSNRAGLTPSRKQSRTSTSVIASNRPSTVATHARTAAWPLFLRSRSIGRARARQARQSAINRRNFQGTGMEGYAPRGRALPVFTIFGPLKIAVSLSGNIPMASYFRLTRGFAFRPKALRRAILHILDQRPCLTARELASCAYCFRRPMIRPGWRIPTNAEVVATRRALRRLVSSGKVAFVGKARRMGARRGHKLFELAKPGVGQR